MRRRIHGTRPTPTLALLLALVVGLAGPVAAAERVTIGFLTTLSGANAAIGMHMRDAAELALDGLDRRMGGLPAEIVYGDDQQKPDVGRQVVERMLKRDRVDVVSGIIWSNVLLAVYPAVIDSNTVLVGANAAPSVIAGERCSKLFFSTSWQGDQTPETMGQYMQSQGIPAVHVMAPNYAAGRDMIAGFKRTFKGRILEEVYTRFGQEDYAVELAALAAARPPAVFVFYPGAMGVAFVKQFAQAGLRERIPLYSAFTIDQVTLPALGALAEGNYEAGAWNTDLPFPANREFVSRFEAKYGYTPSYYAAQSYDAIRLIASGVAKTGGRIEDRDRFVAALAEADFPSVRGKIRFNRNHFPIQDFYLFQVVATEGRFALKTRATVFTDHADSYAEACPLGR